MGPPPCPGVSAAPAARARFGAPKTLTVRILEIKADFITARDYRFEGMTG
jgi:hypothetical protein